MKEYLIKYNGNLYSNVGYFYLGKHPETINISTSLPFLLDFIGKFSEDDSFLTLELGHLLFYLNEDKPVFEEKYDKKLTFNKKTLRTDGDKFEDNIFELLLSNNSGRVALLTFVSKICSYNENVNNHIKMRPSYISNQTNKTVLKNFYNMIVFNLPEFEKILTSNNINYIENNIHKSSFEILEASKLNEVMGIPKFLIKDLKDLGLEDLLEPFKNLSAVLDGNSLKIVLKFLDDMKLIYSTNYKKNIRISKLTFFINKLTKICARKTYKITDLLNYLLRQSMYTGTFGYFSFPCDEAMYLSDYLDMCDKYNLKADKYPSQLRRIHDICAKNIAVLEKQSKVYLKSFEDAIIDYSFVEKEISYTDKHASYKFSFIVPKQIKDLIEEGNQLHHCVGSYSDKIINKESRIVFMRDSSNINTSFITIDIDEDLNLIEAKKAFNEDIDDVYLKIINKWLETIRKERGIL